MTPEVARSLFDYNSDTGELVWKVSNGKAKPGDKAGHSNGSGYLRVGYRYKSHQVTTVIWLLVYGKEPDGEIDHINLNPSDNRFENLRDVSHSQNAANVRARYTNRTGYKGVFYDARRGKFLANIMKDYKSIHIGRFDSAEEAYEAYKQKAAELFGQSARL